MNAAHPLRRLYRYGRGHRRTIVWAVVCSIANKLFDLAPPGLIGAAVDIVVRGEDSIVARLGVRDVFLQLVVLAIITVVIWALESFFEYLHQILWRGLAQTLQHELRLDAYDHVQSLELAYFEDRQTGSLLAILNDDVNQLERFLDGGANDLLQVTTTVIAIGTAFYMLAPGVFALSFLPIPVVLYGSFHFQSRIAPRYAEVRSRVADLSSLLANNLAGVVTIKSFTAEAREVARVSESSRGYERANRQAIRLTSAFSPLIRMVIVCGFTATIVYGGHLTASGELAVGAFSVLVFLTQRLLWPLTRLGSTFDLYQRAMASTSRILDLLDRPIAVRTGERPLPIKAVDGRVRFVDVGFSYPNGFRVFDRFSLEAPAGRTTAIVGPTGSGKSTLVKLLLRLYDTTRGHIEIDDANIAQLDLGDLRRAIGLVSQDVFLFHGTVRENIAYGRPDAADDEIVAAARAAEAHAFIEALPQGYDTMVGERGQKLSGGQRQRLSIARAILKDPPILVLDEATSAVDNETEAAIQRSLVRIARGRTTIVIAHRLSTIRGADVIYVVDGGRVIESGRHQELLDLRGTYAALWNVQTGAGRPEEEDLVRLGPGQPEGITRDPKRAAGDG